MSEEGKFWFGVMRLAAAVICVLIVCISVVTAHSDSVVNEMVKNGTNPIDAYCSIYGSGYTPPAQCALRAAK